jgi:hypothetical protein
MSHRRLFKQTQSLQDSLAVYAKWAREQASRLRPGAERDSLIKKARQADTAYHLEAWVNSAGLQPPE